MHKRIAISVLTLALLLATTVTAETPEWGINAAYTESCSCSVPCPCAFGSGPTLGHCEGNNLVEIEQGHYGDVKLDGISVMTAFRLGDWAKIYVSDNATDEQVDALVKLLKLEPTFGMLLSESTKILSTEKARIEIKRNDDRIRFSVPTSVVELEVVKGKNGKPIKIMNLPMPMLDDHTQYKSIVLSHTGQNQEFSYTGTNGLTSRIDAASK